MLIQLIKLFSQRRIEISHQKMMVLFVKKKHLLFLRRFLCKKQEEQKEFQNDFSLEKDEVVTPNKKRIMCRKSAIFQAKISWRLSLYVL